MNGMSRAGGGSVSTSARPGRDPDGAEETVKVDDPRYLSQLEVGDDLVVTVRQAIAISLDKE
jgi:hypothetical protein